MLTEWTVSVRLCKPHLNQQLRHVHVTGSFFAYRFVALLRNILTGIRFVKLRLFGLRTGPVARLFGTGPTGNTGWIYRMLDRSTHPRNELLAAVSRLGLSRKTCITRVWSFRAHSKVFQAFCHDFDSKTLSLRQTLTQVVHSIWPNNR